MPRIKRWFPVSHDINRDPEIWKLCKLFGERSLRIWLEILSIADRNEGDIPGWSHNASRELIEVLARSSRTFPETTEKVCRTIGELSWITPGSPARVTNHWKYHRIEERKPVPPNLPNLPDLNLNKITPPASPFEERIKTVAQKIYEIDKIKYGRLWQWVNKMRKGFYSEEIIFFALERFALVAKESSISWWPYLTKIVEKESAKCNGRKAEVDGDRHKQEEREFLDKVLRW